MSTPNPISHRPSAPPASKSSSVAAGPAALSADATGAMGLMAQEFASLMEDGGETGGDGGGGSGEQSGQQSSDNSSDDWMHTAGTGASLFSLSERSTQDLDPRRIGEFSQIMEPETEAKKDETPSDQPTNEPVVGDSILRQLQSVSLRTDDVPPVEAVRELPKVVEQIADRILVSAPGLNEAPEVRIEIKEGVLPDTEIRIIQQDGVLQITFVTDAPDASNYLQQNVQQLQQHLNERLPGSQSVQVLVSTKADADPGGDGRSRNRRDMIEEMKQLS